MYFSHGMCPFVLVHSIFTATSGHRIKFPIGRNSRVDNSTNGLSDKISRHFTPGGLTRYAGFIRGNGSTISFAWESGLGRGR